MFSVSLSQPRNLTELYRQICCRPYLNGIWMDADTITASNVRKLLTFKNILLELRPPYFCRPVWKINGTMTTDVLARTPKQAIYITAFALEPTILADVIAKFIKLEFIRRLKNIQSNLPR